MLRGKFNYSLNHAMVLKLHNNYTHFPRNVAYLIVTLIIAPYKYS